MNRFRRALLPLSLSAALAGCGTTPPSNYYLLSPATPVQAQSTTQQTVQIGLGPIDFPAYLDRNKIVVITGAHSLRTAEYHRWAEPLESNFARVLAQNLAAALPGAEIYAYPWRPGVPIEVQVHLQVLRFDVDSENRARLEARWELTGGGDDMLRAPQRRDYAILAASGQYEALVAALSRCVDKLSGDLAASIAQTVSRQ